MSRSGFARALNGVIRHSDGREISIVLISGVDEGVHSAFEDVFSLLNSKLVDLRNEVPWLPETGTMTIGPTGMILQIHDLEVGVPLGEVSTRWSLAAMDERVVHVGLLSSEQFDALPVSGDVEESMPSLVHTITVKAEVTL